MSQVRIHQYLGFNTYVFAATYFDIKLLTIACYITCTKCIARVATTQVASNRITAQLRAVTCPKHAFIVI